MVTVLIIIKWWWYCWWWYNNDTRDVTNDVIVTVVMLLMKHDDGDDVTSTMKKKTVIILIPIYRYTSNFVFMILFALTGSSVYCFSRLCCLTYYSERASTSRSVLNCGHLSSLVLWCQLHLHSFSLSLSLTYLHTKRDMYTKNTCIYTQTNRTHTHKIPFKKKEKQKTCYIT